MINENEKVSYWIDSSDKDWRAMMALFEKGHHTWALFIGRLVIEKLLKAVFLIRFSDNPPFIHDLYRLAEKCRLNLDEERKDILDTISTFNLRARYDDYKMEFHNKCSKIFTQKWINHIKELRNWIKINHLNRS